MFGAYGNASSGSGRQGCLCVRRWRRADAAVRLWRASPAGQDAQHRRAGEVAFYYLTGEPSRQWMRRVAVAVEHGGVVVLRPCRVFVPPLAQCGHVVSGYCAHAAVGGCAPGCRTAAVFAWASAAIPDSVCAVSPSPMPRIRAPCRGLRRTRASLSLPRAWVVFSLLRGTRSSCCGDNSSRRRGG